MVSPEPAQRRHYREFKQKTGLIGTVALPSGTAATPRIFLQRESQYATSHDIARRREYP